VLSGPGSRCNDLFARAEDRRAVFRRAVEPIAAVRGTRCRTRELRQYRVARLAAQMIPLRKDRNRQRRSGPQKSTSPAPSASAATIERALLNNDRPSHRRGVVEEAAVEVRAGLVGEQHLRTVPRAQRPAAPNHPTAVVPDVSCADASKGEGAGNDVPDNEVDVCANESTFMKRTVAPTGTVVTAGVKPALVPYAIVVTTGRRQRDVDGDRRRSGAAGAGRRAPGVQPANAEQRMRANTRTGASLRARVRGR